MSWAAHPFRPDLGRTAMADEERHVREMLEAVLFTTPGERVNRPDFGCGLMELVFAGNGPDLAVAVEMTVAASVQRWLGDWIMMESLSIRAEDSTLFIALTYRSRLTQDIATATFERSVT